MRPPSVGQWLISLLPVAPLPLLFAAVFFQGQVFYERDVHLVWYSQVESFARAVRSGAWPLWDPFVSFGHPMLANPNAQVLYPPTWINLLLAPETAYVVLAMAHLAWAGFGLARLARRLGLSAGSSALAGAAWLASGPLLSLVNVWHHLAGASWIPWVFLAADDALESPGLRGAAVWGATLGLQVLAGSPDMSAFTGVALLVFTLGRLDARRPLADANRRRLFTAALALMFALGTAAGQLLPVLEAAGRSLRWNIDPTLREIGSLHPAGALLKAFSPVPLGDLPLDPVRGRILLDEGMPFLRSLYLGVPALALVLVGLLGPAPSGTRRRGFFAGLGLAAALFALGTHTWAYPALVTLFPPLRTLRYPSKAMVLAAFAWALLVGLGFERWRGKEESPTRARRLAVGVPMACLLVLLALAWHVERNPATYLGPFLVPERTLGQPWAEAFVGFAPRVGAAAALGAAALAVLLARWGTTAGARTIAALALADLVLAGAIVNRTTPRQFYRYRPSLLDAVDQRDGSRLFVRSYPESQALLGIENPYKIAWYPQGLSFDAGRALGARLALMPPVGAAWGLFASYDRDLLGLYPGHLAALVDSLHAAEGTEAWRRWLELGAVRHVAALDPRGLAGLELVGDLATPLVLPLRLYRVPDPRPRSFVVGGARVADGEAARAMLADPGFDPRREIVLATDGQGSARSSPASFAGTSRVIELVADRVRLQASLAAPGYLVLVDTYDPGWQATVDGARAPVLRANESFRAVALPAGEHEVEMVYRPRSVLVGLGISTAALAAVALVLARSRRGDPT